MFEVQRLPGPVPPGNAFIVGVDLGQAVDYTAIAIIEKLDRPAGNALYHIRQLERTRASPYPLIISRVKTVIAQLPGAELVVDATGVGQPVIDSFTQAGLRPISIFIHGGDKANCDESENAKGKAKGWVMGASRRWRVPKRDLVGVLQVLLQNKRMKIAQGPLSDTLAAEMLNFRVKIDPVTAHDSYSAWREQDNDDLVLATALGCWWGEHARHPVLVSSAAAGTFVMMQ